MKKRILTALSKIFIFIFLLSACNNGDDSSTNPDLPTEETTIAKYSLTFRGEESSWTDENPEDANFSLHQVPSETEGYFSIGIAMIHEAATPTQSHGVTFSALVAEENITSGALSPATYSLVHIHTYDEEKDCFDTPEGCTGYGIALVQGTEPPSGSGVGLSGVDNDIHAESGTLTITDFIITENTAGVIKGLVSGNFSLTGINTNGSKPNPGTASGSFENAPFKTLSY